MSQIDDIRKRHGIGETLAACSWEDDEESGMCRWYQHDVGILLNEVDRLQRNLGKAFAIIDASIAGLTPVHDGGKAAERTRAMLIEWREPQEVEHG